MKIGILTLYYKNYNFGGQLQAYALQRCLTNLGYEAEQIQFNYFTHFKDVKPIRRKISLIKHMLMNHEIYVEEKKLITRRKLFDQFIDMVPHSNIVYRDIDIDELNNSYDCFVCGGDQIWNDWNSANWICDTALSIFSLGFVEDDKIAFSYAPSIGKTTLTSTQKGVLGESFKKLCGISVREKSNLKEVSDLTDKKVTVVVDPVFLLNVKEWNSLIKNETLSNEHYAFCYFLSNNLHIAKWIKKYATSHYVTTICEPNSSGNMSNINSEEEWGDMNDYRSGPIEFIKKIRDAEIVFTDSFHAVVFSIIFNKPFYVFGRSDGNSAMNNRLYDLLDEYGLTDRFIANPDNLLTITEKQIDYEAVNSKLCFNRKQSIEYIKDCIKNE